MAWGDGAESAGNGRTMDGTLGIHGLWLFILSGFLLNVTPGPDTAYIVGRSVQLGWRGGAAAALGISCGCLVHVFGAAIGLSAIVITHQHPDHVDAARLPALLEANPDAALYADSQTAEQLEVPCQRVQVGDELSVLTSGM